MTAAAVADASPLIALQQVGRLELLLAVFGEVSIPPAVAREIRPSVPASGPELRVAPSAYESSVDACRVRTAHNGTAHARSFEL